MPGPDAVKRALDVLKGASKPLIILGKGAAYAQADEDIRALVEKKWCSVSAHEYGQRLVARYSSTLSGPGAVAGSERSGCRPADRGSAELVAVSRQRKTWGTKPKQFIQVDIEPKEMDSNVEIVAPVVGDIGSCVNALLEGMGDDWAPPPEAWTSAVSEKKETNIARMAPRLQNNNVPMDYHGALGVLRNIIAERPDAVLVNEGANTLDFARSIIDMYKPRKRLDVGTWGVMGIGMGQAVAAAVETGCPVLAIEGDSAFGFSGMEIETICRYNLPVCVVVFNNGGIYRGTDQNPTGGEDVAPTVFVKGSRYDKMIEAFGGLGYNVESPDELKRAVNEAMDAGKPALINAVIDETAGTESGRIGNLNPQSVVSKR